MHLLRLGVACRNLDDYGTSSAAASLAATRWLREWAQSVRADGEDLKRWLRLADTSIWWYMDTWLVESGYFEPLHAVTQRIDRISDLLDDIQPVRVLAVSVDEDIATAARTLCLERGIPCEVRDVKKSRHPRGRLVAIAVAKLARLFMRAATQWIFDRLPGTSATASEDRSVLVYSGDNWQSVYDPVSASFRTGDLHLVGVLGELARDHRIDFVAYIRQFAFGLRAPFLKRKERRESRVSYRPFEAYVTLAIVRRSLSLRRELMARWRSLSSRPAIWDAAARYRGVPLGSPLRERMRFFMSFLSLEAIIDHELGREAVRRAGPAVALVLGESRREARSILLSCRASGVPTVALQHGRFADHHFALTADDLRGHDLVSDVPLPDRFAVYGTRDRDYLVEKAHIPADRIVVTGAPRWDVLANWRTLYQPVAIRERLGLDPDGRVLLFTTTEVDETDTVAAIVFAFVRHNPGVQVVVKTHPAERGSVRYRRAADHAGVHPIIVQNFDLYELLSASVALVSPISTTLVDAAMMGRPSILLDPLNLDRIAVFDHHPAITVTTSADDFEVAAAAALQPRDPAVDPRVTSDFVARFGLRLDGLAHRRVADLVRETERDVSRNLGSVN